VVDWFNRLQLSWPVRDVVVAVLAVASGFVIELLKISTPVNLKSSTPGLLKSCLLIHCAKCEAGSRLARTSKFGAFHGSNNSWQ
jgi:hypothetical protein